MENRSGEPFSGAEFRRGVELFNSGLFFEAHEVWEELWKAQTADRKLALQGLIQIAAGFVKLERGNHAAARKLWRLGLEKLERAGAIGEEFAFSSFSRGLQVWIKTPDLERVDRIALPRIG